MPRVSKKVDLERKRTTEPLVFFLILVSLSVSLGFLPEAHAHGAGEAPWLPVHKLEGQLTVSMDDTLSQWSIAHHTMVGSLDGPELDVMSIHNGTYMVLMVQRPFNASVQQAGVAVHLDGSAFNSSDVTWGWVAGQNNSTDPTVTAMGTLTAGTLTVVFGRPLAPSSSGLPRLEVGRPYGEAIHPTSWNNGTRAGSIDYSGVDPVGLELLPRIELYPKTPFVYSTVLLIGMASFLFLELRRYRK